MLLLGVASVLQSTLYALQRFTMPALSLAARNASVVLAVLVLGRALGVHSLVVGILVGAVLLVALQIPGFRGTGLRIRPSFAWRDPALRRIGALYLPVFLGLLLNSWALIMDRNLAETTGEHGIAAMRFATQVQQLTVGMVVTAISIATLPRLSRAAAEEDEEAFRPHARARHAPGDDARSPGDVRADRALVARSSICSSITARRRRKACMRSASR